jgi:hypothetical protein
MKWNRRFTTLVLAFALVAGLGCTTSDSTAPLAPSTEQENPSFGLIGDLTGGLTETVGDLTGTLVGTLGSRTPAPSRPSAPKAVCSKSGVIRW